MSTQDGPQLYLLTPERFELDVFAPLLASVMDAHPVACLRLNLAQDDEAEARRAADHLRDLAHQRDVAVVIADHWRMVAPHGLDGVHLSDGSRKLRDARKAVGPDAIVGCYCAASRHDGITAGEIGADYVSFGPVTDDGLLGDGEVAETDLFEWWGQMVEVPLIAEGNITPAMAAALSGDVEFLAIGREIWGTDDPVATLKTLMP